jgi:predicted nuclease of predicted toxin-antitoxin system
MRLLLDANVHRDLTRILQDLGHDVETIAATRFRSSPDPEILTIAFQANRVLVTNDRDFGELVFKHKRPHRGVIYLRLATTLAPEIAIRIQDVIESGLLDYEGFVVATERRMRLRYS